MQLLGTWYKIQAYFNRQKKMVLVYKAPERGLTYYTVAKPYLKYIKEKQIK